MLFLVLLNIAVSGYVWTCDVRQQAQSDMLRSLLLANSQMMYAINTLEKEMMKMREALSSHEAKLQQSLECCHRLSLQKNCSCSCHIVSFPDSDVCKISKIHIFSLTFQNHMLVNNFS